MKKILLSLSVAASVFATTITVGATPVPHAQILELAKDYLAKQGHELKIVEFTDYLLPNYALEDEELNANFYQHKPYLDEFNKQKGTHLKGVFAVHLEPLAAYSKKIKSVNELKKGALIYIPNDPVNENRALEILAKNKLIELDDEVDLKTPLDIVKNPLNLEIKELEAAQLARVLDECDLALINSNYALEAGLNPSKDAVLIEDKNSPYANLIVVRSGDENSPKTKLLIDAIKNSNTKEFIEQKYGGAIIPSF